MAKLKVFRTPIGFHDAFVAAPSRKAALAAWGSDRDLFARGVAEEVTDPALMDEPLARPGEVVKRSRGTAAEQFAALPDKPKVTGKRAPAAAEPVRERRPAKPPKPDRDALDTAETAVAKADARAAAVAKDFDAREAALARERRAAERDARDAIAQAERTRDREARTYDRAIAAWRDA